MPDVGWLSCSSWAGRGRATLRGALGFQPKCNLGCQKDTDTVYGLRVLPEPQKSPGNTLHVCITDSMVPIRCGGMDRIASQNRLIHGLMGAAVFGTVLPLAARIKQEVSIK